MLRIKFEGWFQCRIPTDPDPTDEPRGVSGYTFALAGERDLDRIIRLQNPVDPRSHGPEVGVKVTAVDINDNTVPAHPLIGASLNLLGDPKFEMLNYILATEAGTQAIYPFELLISGGGITIYREDLLDPENPTAGIYDLPFKTMERRGGALRLLDKKTVQEITHCKTHLDYRMKRRSLLEDDLQKTADPVTRAALGKRIQQLNITDPKNRRVRSLSFKEHRSFDMNGPIQIVDDENRIGVELDTEKHWPIDFWNGVWDPDALCGYMRGTLQIP